MNWWELAWPDFEKADERIALLPTGVIEAHGPHLPLRTDALMALYVAEKAAERANALLSPWPGTAPSSRTNSPAQSP